MQGPKRQRGSGSSNVYISPFGGIVSIVTMCRTFPSNYLSNINYLMGRVVSMAGRITHKPKRK